jgi:hypothetical protein
MTAMAAVDQRTSKHDASSPRRMSADYRAVRANIRVTVIAGVVAIACARP